MSVSHSQDGRFIGTGSVDRTVRLWNAVSGALIATLHGHTKIVKSIVFAPDSQSIVSCSDDSTIRVWHVETTRSLSSADGSDALAALAFAKFEREWLSSQSGNLLLWVPEPYRNYVQVAPCTMLIGLRRVVVAADKIGLYVGENWTACWRELAPDRISHAL